MSDETELLEIGEQLLTEVCQPLSFTRLRRIFVMLTKIHFSSPDNYGETYRDMLGCLYYDLAKPEKSKLQIRLLHQLNEQDPDHVPAIYVGLADSRFVKTAIGNFSGHNEDLSQTFLTAIGQTRLRCVVVTEDPDHSLALAESMATFLETIKESVMRQMGLHSLDLVAISDVQSRKPEPTQAFRVDADFNIQFPFACTRFEESHRLKKIALHLRPPP